MKAVAVVRLFRNVDTGDWELLLAWAGSIILLDNVITQPQILHPDRLNFSWQWASSLHSFIILTSNEPTLHSCYFHILGKIINCEQYKVTAVSHCTSWVSKTKFC